MSGSWAIEDNYGIDFDESGVCSSKQKRYAATVVEALIVSDLAQEEARSMRN